MPRSSSRPARGDGQKSPGVLFWHIPSLVNDVAGEIIMLGSERGLVNYLNTTFMYYLLSTGCMLSTVQNTVVAWTLIMLQSKANIDNGSDTPSTGDQEMDSSHRCAACFFFHFL